jgi:hypothetical protein
MEVKRAVEPLGICILDEALEIKSTSRAARRTLAADRQERRMLLFSPLSHSLYMTGEWNPATLIQTVNNHLW